MKAASASKVHSLRDRFAFESSRSNCNFGVSWATVNDPKQTLDLFKFRHKKAPLVNILRKIGYVLGIATLAPIVAYLSIAGPALLAFGPLVPVIVFFGMFEIVPDVEWAAAAALFFCVYFALAIVLSLGLFLEYMHSWRVLATMFAVLTLGNFAYFVIRWNAAMGTQGLAYTGLLLLANIAAASVVGSLLVRSKRDQSRPLSLVSTHASIIFWLSWASFPWLGEYL